MASQQTDRAFLNAARTIIASLNFDGIYAASSH